MHVPTIRIPVLTMKSRHDEQNVRLVPHKMGITAPTLDTTAIDKMAVARPTRVGHLLLSESQRQSTAFHGALDKSMQPCAPLGHLAVVGEIQWTNLRLVPARETQG